MRSVPHQRDQYVDLPDRCPYNRVTPIDPITTTLTGEYIGLDQNSPRLRGSDIPTGAVAGARER